MILRILPKFAVVMLQFPNAKINLGLDILRRRPDGYHDIETVMWPVGWCDVLEIVPSDSPSTTLTVTGRTVACPPEKNLVMKAYNALAERVGGLPPVDIYLRKIIPDGAGLGGGSSDASFTLKILNEMFSLGLTDEELAEVAAHLGADCPFFIYNRPMLATGTGTDLTPVDVDLEGLHTVIVKPPVSVPTAAAYSAVTPAVPEVPLIERLSLPVEEWQGKVVNDFEPSVFPAYPAVAEVKRRLMDAGAVYVSMSGSGSAVYALFRDDKLAEEVSRLFPDCAVAVV